MPNIITHSLFAQTVKKEIKEPMIKQCVMKYPHEFIIGSNGPDFLFFYHFFDPKGEPIREIGSQLHSSHINDFYRIALEEINKQEDNSLKEAMISYVAGHLCHWALDSRSHPYIFYRTGDCTGNSLYMHHRFESMLDAMMLKKLLNKNIKQYNYDLLTSRSKWSIPAISAIYVPAVNQIFDANIDASIIGNALKDWQRLNALLHDPTQVKTKIVTFYEKKVQIPWLYSGHIVPANIDETYDVLNQSHQQWCYPTDNTRTSNESFMEIFQRAKKLVLECMNAMNDSNALCAILNDETYDSGTRCGEKMQYFDLIYEE